MAPTSENRPIGDAQVLIGPLFSEPMRVETVRANGSDSWVAGFGRNANGTFPRFRTFRQ